MEENRELDSCREFRLDQGVEARTARSEFPMRYLTRSKTGVENNQTDARAIPGPMAVDLDQ